MDGAEALSDLGAIPGKRLEALGGDLKGLYSIRVNDQWRICFQWADTEALEVEPVTIIESFEYGQENPDDATNPPG